MTLDTYLKEVRERLAAATPGPGHIGHVSQLDDNHESADIDGPSGEEIAHVFPRRNQAFIASAPTDIAKLLEVIECLSKGLTIFKEIGEMFPEDVAMTFVEDPSVISWAEHYLAKADEIVGGGE